MTDFPSSRIEISRSAYRHNLEFIQHLIGKKCKFSSVIKGNAYGHNIPEFAKIAHEEGVDHFSVFNTHEAYEAYEALRPDAASTPNAEIMIMGDCDGEGLEWAVNHGIEIFVFDFMRLQDAINTAQKYNLRARIHIEVETGMNRTGFELNEIEQVSNILNNHKDELSLEGLCTHYAGAESVANYYRIQKQYKNYKKALAEFKSFGVKFKRRHVLCSAGIINYPKMRMDMARVGVLQYGFWPTPETKVSFLTQNEDDLSPKDSEGYSYIRRLMTWRGHIMALKTVKKGEFIGYGISYMAERDMQIATIPTGYGYGYTRALSNQGRVLINGVRCNVVGLVNMNVLMADVTHLSNVQKGDPVILIGRDGDQEVSVASFADMSNLLNYELLARLPHNIPRVIVD